MLGSELKLRASPRCAPETLVGDMTAPEAFTVSDNGGNHGNSAGCLNLKMQEAAEILQ
jgi:hypothetical protein